MGETDNAVRPGSWTTRTLLATVLTASAFASSHSAVSTAGDSSCATIKTPSARGML